MGNFTIPPDLVRGEEADFLPLAGEANWGMKAFNISALRDVYAGEGVIVGGVDTGVDRKHPLLSNCFAAKDFTGSRVGSGDVNKHGTHITGTIGATDPNIGVAYRCRTVHGKALSDGGAGGGDWIAAAIRWCVEQGAEIISMSLGSPSEDPMIVDAMREVSEQGVWCIAAAGNSGIGTPNVDWPGRSPYAISVAALNADLTVASFSNSGAKIDTAGAGVNIWSTRPGGGFMQMSGTSMATPFVAGMLACYRSGLKKLGLPIPHVEELRKLLFSRSTDIGPVGDDNRSGPGWITPMLLTLNLTPDPKPVI